jgi:hypothetical protein
VHLPVVAVALVVVAALAGTTVVAGDTGAGDRAGAAPLESGRYVGFSVAGDTQDVYAVQLADGETLVVDALFDHADADVNVFVVDGPDATLAHAVSETDDERLAYTAHADGTYYVVVSTFGGGRAAYALDVAVTRPELAADRMEPNDALERGRTLAPGTYRGLTRQPGDRDVFAVVVEAGQALAVRVDTAEPGVDLDVVVSNESGDIVAAGVASGPVETVYVPAGPARVLVVSIEAAAPLAETGYDLTVRLEEGADDAFEPNDGFAAATDISQGRYAGLAVGLDDRDVYRVTVPAGGGLLALAQATGPDGLPADGLPELSMVVVESQGSVGSASELAGSGGPTVLLPSPEGGEYYLVVSTVDPEAPETTYTLSVAVAGGQGGADDVPEPDPSPDPKSGTEGDPYGDGETVRTGPDD